MLRPCARLPTPWRAGSIMIACGSVNADGTNRHKDINTVEAQSKAMASLVLGRLQAPTFVSFSELTSVSRGNELGLIVC
jgi:hypothetical protein